MNIKRSLGIKEYTKSISNESVDIQKDVLKGALLNIGDEHDGFHTTEDTTNQYRSSDKLLFFSKSLLLKEGILPLNESTIIENNGVKKAIDITDDSVDVTPEELMLYMQLKENKDIRTIKNCAIFFTVLAVIGLVGGFLIGLNII